MTYLDYGMKSAPTGVRKLAYLNWPLALLLAAAAGFGILMLYSVAGGSMEPWARSQMTRFGAGLAVMFAMAMVPIWTWRKLALPSYVAGLVLLLLVEFFGEIGMGAQRWIDLGVARFQPSELMKVALVMAMAAYYDWLPIRRVSHPFFVLLPVSLILLPAGLVLRQPDLGTSILLVFGGAAMMFLAGVHWLYFATVGLFGVALVILVLQSRGTEWQLLSDYQYRRIDSFLDPSIDPLGAGYHITQSKIALGSGGWSGRGFMQGTQTRLNFLPEKHTDFIFTTLAEEFGLVGGMTLLAIYGGILVVCVVVALSARDRFGQLVSLGVAITFFLFFAVNMSMVMGLAPVVGVPLPMVSYGGSAMLVLLAGFGLVQSASVHRPR